MSYVIVTEAQAAAAEYVKDALSRLKAVLDANVAVLKSGGRSIRAETVYLGAQHALGQFPAVQIEPTGCSETLQTLPGGGSGENLLRMTFRVFAYDVATGEAGKLVQNLLQLMDRVQTVLRHNPTLDGFSRSMEFGGVVYGRLRGGPRTANPLFAPHPILAAQMDVVVEKEIARP